MDAVQEIADRKGGLGRSYMSADPAVISAARQLMKALEGMTYEDAQAALDMAQQSVAIAAVVQSAP